MTDGNPAATPPTTPPPQSTPPPPAAQAAAPPAAASPPPTDWTGGFNDEMKGYVQNKGFKGPQDVLESYRNYEKLQGVPQDRLLKLPEDMNTPEGRAVFERLGTPKEAKDYGLKPTDPKNPDAAKFGEWAEKTFFEVGVPKGMAQKIVEQYAKFGEAMTKAQTDAQQMNMKNAEQNLRKEWGNAFDQNKNMADQGAIALGMGETEVAALGRALGPDKAMMLLLKLATATGEHSFVSGDPSHNRVLDPNQAQSRLDELMSDADFRAKYLKGDQAARRQVDQIHQMAHPGMANL